MGGESMQESKEERRARRQAKREKKNAALGRKEASNAADHGYTDTANPFGDANLTEAFEWKKHGGSSDVKREELNEEIRKVKRRRDEREEQLRVWDKERQRELADKDGLTIEEWEEKGNEFEYDQLLMRANNRLKEKRLTPFDVLLFTLRVLSGLDTIDKVHGDVREPTKIISGLSIGDLKALLTEAEDMVQYDRRHTHLWQAIIAVGKAELAEQLAGDRKEGMHSNVKGDVTRQFEGKTKEELEEAERMIKQQLRSNDAGIDVEFWDTLLKQLTVWKSRSVLTAFYDTNIKTLMGAGEGGTHRGATASSTAEHTGALFTDDSDTEAYLETSGLSPTLTPLGAMDEQEIDRLTGERDDIREMMVQRMSRLVLKDQRAEQEMLMMARGDKLNDEEDMFDDLVDIKKSYEWHDKYRPRKPRYFNKVHTGFDWNKYNSTHYDADNPPPKRVMGYKFNIFYPDLVDPTQQPVYFLEYPGDKGRRAETCVLRFSAGPPYEDIAFRIVNKEWDKHYRGGYKCTFDRGVFALHFSFVKYRYRR